MKQSKFNLVDLLVVLVLVAGIAFVGLRIFGGQEAATPGEAGTYQVTFYAECVSEALANTLTEGSTVVTADRNMEFGTLHEVVLGPSVCYGFNAEGQCIETTKPGHVSVRLVCQVPGIQQSTGLLVGKYYLNLGQSRTICCGNAELEMVVSDFQIVN